MNSDLDVRYGAPQYCPKCGGSNISGTTLPDDCYWCKGTGTVKMVLPRGLSRGNKIKILNDSINKLSKEIKESSDDIFKEVGLRIKENRRRISMSQETMSKIVGVSRSQIANIELGNSGFSIRTLIKICTALDITPNDLLGY